MELIFSKHWILKRKYRNDITNELMIYAIQNSIELRDENWSDAFNAITKVPPSGRILKVVYKKLEDKIKIITAFWLD